VKIGDRTYAAQQSIVDYTGKPKAEHPAQTAWTTFAA
jgi:hypothetical protein